MGVELRMHCELVLLSCLGIKSIVLFYGLLHICIYLCMLWNILMPTKYYV